MSRSCIHDGCNATFLESEVKAPTVTEAGYTGWRMALPDDHENVPAHDHVPVDLGETWIAVMYSEHGVRNPEPHLVKWRQSDGSFTFSYETAGDAARACVTHFEFTRQHGVHKIPGNITWGKQLDAEDDTRWTGCYLNPGTEDEFFPVYYVMMLTSGEMIRASE